MRLQRQVLWPLPRLPLKGGSLVQLLWVLRPPPRLPLKGGGPVQLLWVLRVPPRSPLQGGGLVQLLQPLPRPLAPLQVPLFRGDLGGLIVR